MANEQTKAKQWKRIFGDPWVEMYDGSIEETNNDDRRVMAASPELLAACQLVLSWLTAPKDELPPAATNKMVHHLRHAIQSATKD